MSSGEGDRKFKAQFSGDRATAPTPLEDQSENTWQEFIRLQTEPAPLSLSSGSPSAHQYLRGSDSAATLESVMQIARRSNRACPQPAQWQRLHALLPPRGGDNAPQSTSEKDWKRVPPMQKRLLLRDQLEWAAATDVLPAVQAFLADLSEDDWDHF